MSKARERAYERRRYEEWQAKLAERQSKRAQRRRQALAGGSAVAAILLVVGVVFLVTGGDDDPADSAAAPDSSTAPSATPSVTPVEGGCEPSTLPAVAEPEQTEKAPAKSVAAGKTFTVALKTTCGDITMKLDGAKAPQAVAAVTTLAKDGFYDKTPCHRVTTTGLFVLQCGDPTGTGSGGPGYQYGPVENAPKDGIYPEGTVAMARSTSPDSNGSQFFLVYQETQLPTDGGGYTVIGKITKGLGVVEKVAKSGDVTGAGDGAPVTPVSITSVKVTED